MKNNETKSISGFRELSHEEMFETTGGLCVFPILVGQKLAEKLIDLISSDKT